MNTRTYNAIRSIQARYGLSLDQMETPEDLTDRNGLPLLRGDDAANIRHLLTLCELTDGPETYRFSFIRAWTEDHGCCEEVA